MIKVDFDEKDLTAIVFLLEISPDMDTLLQYLTERKCEIIPNFGGVGFVVKDSITERYHMFYQEELPGLGFKGVLEQLKRTFKEET